MEFTEFLKYFFTFISGLGAGSLLTFTYKNNSRNQSNNTVNNGSMTNGNYTNGNNNNITDNNEKGN